VVEDSLEHLVAGGWSADAASAAVLVELTFIWLRNAVASDR